MSAGSQSLKRMKELSENLKVDMGESANATQVDLTKRAEMLSSGRVPYRDLQSMYEDLKEKYTRVSNEKDEMTALAQQRQEAFLRTEEKYKDDMRNLEVRLQKMGLEDKSRMEPLRNMHGNIQDTIQSIQNKTARVLQDQERDLIRAFRARLADVTVELENERKKNESGSAEWVARCRKLTEELEWLRDLTDKLTSENKSVLKDNRRFKRQMKTQEEDREFLIKQLVSVKKENARLRYSFDQVMAGNISAVGGLHPADGFASLPPGSNTQNGAVSSITGQPMTNAKAALRAGTPVTDAWGNRSGTSTPFGGASRGPSRPQSAFNAPPSRAGTASGQRPVTAAPVVQSSPGPAPEGWAEKEFRFKSIVGKLQRQLEDYEKKYRSLRTNYTAELSSRTELQSFLKKCIDDVRNDMAARGRSQTLRRAEAQHRVASAGAMRSKSALPPPVDPRNIPLNEFTAQDRISVMEWLLSQDQVIFMLYEKIFPQQRPPIGLGANLPTSPEAEHRNLPGGLFHSPEHLSSTSAHTSHPSSHRPSSSPVNQASFTGGRDRPQTAAAASSSLSRNSSSHSNSSAAAAAAAQAQAERAAAAYASAASSKRPSGSIPNDGSLSQYEKPLGARPLSGYDHTGTSNAGSTHSSRPQSAFPTHSRTASSSSRPAATSTTGGPSAATLQAEVEAELNAHRASRQNSHHQMDEDDGGDDLNQSAGSYDDDDAGGLSDDDQDRHLYEQKEDEQDQE